MGTNVLQSADASHVRMDPYPHVIIENALPESLYAELDSSFPESLLMSDHPTVGDDRGHTRRYSSQSALNERQLNNAWLEFFAEHVSESFYRRVTNDILADAIRHHYPDQAQSILDGEVTPRQHTNQAISSTPIITDCQLVLNEIMPHDRTSRTPHLDAATEIYAALLYMRPRDETGQGGDLDIYASRAPKPIIRPDTYGNREVMSMSVRHVSSCPYQANTLVLFLNCRHGVHGVRPMQNQSRARRSVNIIGEYGDGRSLFTLS